MKDEKTKAAQGLLLWVISDFDDRPPQQYPWLLSYAYVPCPSVHLGAPGLDLEYTPCPRISESFSTIYWWCCVQGPTDPGRAGLDPGLPIPSLGPPYPPYSLLDLGLLDTAHRGASLLALICAF